TLLVQAVGALAQTRQAGVDLAATPQERRPLRLAGGDLLGQSGEVVLALGNRGLGADDVPAGGLDRRRLASRRRFKLDALRIETGHGAGGIGGERALAFAVGGDLRRAALRFRCRL